MKNKLQKCPEREHLYVLQGVVIFLSIPSPFCRDEQKLIALSSWNVLIKRMQGGSEMESKGQGKKHN